MSAGPLPTEDSRILTIALTATAFGAVLILFRRPLGHRTLQDQQWLARWVPLQDAEGYALVMATIGVVVLCGAALAWVLVAAGA